MSGSVLLTILSLLAPPASDSVYGTVRDAVSGTPLVGVRVEAEAGGSGGFTRKGGVYVILVASSGPQVLRFVRPGYDPLPLSLTIPDGTSLHVDVELEPIPLPLPALEVATTKAPPTLPTSTHDSSNIGFRHLATDDLSSNPLVMGDDPLVATAASPEAATGAGFPSSLRVHGGGSDQNLILLEGLPVYGLMHLGGAASLFDPDAVESVDLHSAVPPADLTGRLSSTVNVHLRPPDPRNLHLSGAWDPTTVRQLAEGSVAGGALSMLVSGRQSYRGVFAQDGDGMLGNEFNDILARGSLALPHNDLQLYLLKGADHLRFPSTTQRSAADDAQMAESPRNQFTWSSQTAGAVWRHFAAPDAVLTTRSWMASSAAGIDWAATAGPQRVASELQELGVSSDLALTKGSSQQKLGFSLQRTYAEYQVAPLSSAGGVLGVPPFQLRSAPIILGAFAEEQRELGSRWTISAGLRVNSVNASGFALEPRLSLRYRPTPAVTLLAGAARVHQYVQSMRNEESLLDYAVGADLPVAVGMPGVRPARSDQISGEIQARISPQVTVTLNGYARRFTDVLIPAAVSAAPFASKMAPLGSGHAQGVELEARYDRDQLEVKANLGMADAHRAVGSLEFSPGASRGRWAALGAVRRIGASTRIRLASTLTSGNPASVVAGGVEWQSPGGWASSGEIAGSPQETLGSLNQRRLPTYFRTDLGLSRRWRMTPGGRDAALTTTLTITNLFNRRNVLGYSAAPDGLTRQTLLFPVRSLVVQLGWRF